MGCVFKSDKPICLTKGCNINRFILGDGDNAIAYDKTLRSYNAGIDEKCNSMS